ncbi:uncharacterized protein LOC127641639 [Xyrauchen texanus]|uniref:uncharacterized protein LOC127641639 n=1 Tax=Xyrauchen texanus TaxID=154827 RepID=UPI002241ADA0|nr:uncharacterized protein LOC127641639 [Xyrauchen texanus]
MAAAVLDKIARKCQQIERAQSQGNCGERELRAIDDCLRNAQRISYLLPLETYEELNRNLDEIRTMLSTHLRSEGTTAFSVSRRSSGSRGRPAIQITRDQIEFLMKQGHTVKRMARMLGCSSSFLYKRSKLLGVSIRSRMSGVDDEELENVVRRLQCQYPNTGNEMMRALLVAEGLRVSRHRVREMLVRINPAAAARRWSSTVARRVYHVPCPNSLWHIDGNMRLIRWGFVIHGAIDGHSRLITYLNCNTNNCASTVLSQFIQATCLYGLPSRVRSDHGGENIQVALFMNLVQGLQRRSHITGESVHNQRIEPMTFTKFQLSIVFLPQIQGRLQHFKEAWNHHALRTENNKTPTQIWTEGMLSMIGTDSTAINNVFGDDLYRPEHFNELLVQHGIESLPTAENEEIPAVTVDQPQINLTPQQMETVSHAIDHIADLKLKFQVCCAEIANVLAN